MNKASSVAAICLVVGGCAAGKNYDYTLANIELPFVGADALGVAVVDRRPYVLSGDKQPEFVGAERGPWGVPFDVTTASGKSMAADMQAVLARALESNGYKVTELFFSSPDNAVVAEAVTKNGAERNVVLTLNEWKTDVYVNLGLTYNVVLRVVDENSQVLAQTDAEATGEKIGVGELDPKAGLFVDIAKQRSRDVAKVFELKVSRLFNSPEIKEALNSE